jgi:hypothetical protein
MKGSIVNYVGISPGAKLILLAGPTAALDMSVALFFLWWDEKTADSHSLLNQGQDSGTMASHLKQCLALLVQNLGWNLVPEVGCPDLSLSSNTISPQKCAVWYL